MARIKKPILHQGIQIPPFLYTGNLEPQRNLPKEQSERSAFYTSASFLFETLHRLPLIPSKFTRLFFKKLQKPKLSGKNDAYFLSILIFSPFFCIFSTIFRHEICFYTGHDYEIEAGRNG